MQVSDLFESSDIRVDRDAGAIDVSALVYDSRRAEPRCLFAALPGSRSDGHDHVADAVARGAAAVLCERPVDTGGALRIIVPDSRRALATAARRFYGDPAAALTLVGVTGTNGKTTTIHLIEGMLAVAGQRPGVIGTLGTRYRTAAGEEVAVEGALTTPESVDLVASLATMVAVGTSAVAMEVSSHGLAQERVAGVAFDVGVFTNLTHDHLDYHGSFDDYFAAKARLIRERLKPGGQAVINLDDPHVAALAEEGRAIGFSRGRAGRVTLAAVRSTRSGITARIRVGRASIDIASPLVGEFNVENILAAVATGVALGLSSAEIRAGIAAVPSVPGRLERVGEAPLVLVDYAHTPDALAKSLAAARELTGGRLVCVFGCGGDRDADKRAPMGAVVAAAADQAIVTNDNPRTEDPAVIAAAICEGLVRRGWRRDREFVIELDRGVAIERAVAAAGLDDTVLIAGKGHETVQTIGVTRHHFDDREVARAALARQDGRAP